MLIEDKTYDKVDFTISPIGKGEYESCTFNSCDFSNTDLSEITFLECRFNGCNLSLAKLVNAVFRDAVFKDCKLLGLRFNSNGKFGLSFRFENCMLNHSSFDGATIKNTLFKNCLLQEADFTGSDLTGSVFDCCDFTRAVFENTIVEKADFRTSVGYSINPITNRIKKAKFSLSAVSGLLDVFDIEIDNGR